MICLTPLALQQRDGIAIWERRRRLRFGPARHGASSPRGLPGRSPMRKALDLPDHVSARTHRLPVSHHDCTAFCPTPRFSSAVLLDTLPEKASSAREPARHHRDRDRMARLADHLSNRLMKSDVHPSVSGPQALFTGNGTRPDHAQRA